MKKNVSLSLIALILIALVTYFYLNNDKKDTKPTLDTELDMSFNIPLTGPLSTYGEAIRDGVLLAYEDLNGESKKIHLDIKDNKSEAKTSVSILKQQLMKDSDIYISGVKPQTMSIIDEVSSKKIPHFTWVFDAFVTKDYVNTYRTWVSYKIEPKYYFKYIEKRKAKRVAIAYVKLPHTDEEFQKIVKPYLDKNNIEYIVEEYPYGKKEFKDIGAKFKSFKPDLLVLNGFKGELINMVKYFREIDLSNNTGNTICTYDFLDATEDLSSQIEDGIRFISPQYFSKKSTSNTEWSNRFKEKFGRTPRYTDAYAYDMMSIIIKASESVNDFSNTDEWNKAFESIKMEGLTGNLQFDETGDLMTNLDIIHLEDNKIIVDVE